jgi:hypothetical protein
MSERIYNVLFLCTGNTARSILAESILRKDGRRNFRAFSAGSQPKGTVNPFAIKVLNRLEYPMDELRSKSWEDGFCLYGLRQRGWRILPGMAGTADDGALGDRTRRRSRGRTSRRKRPSWRHFVISRIESPPSRACRWKASTDCRSERGCVTLAGPMVRRPGGIGRVDVRL